MSQPECVTRTTWGGKPPSSVGKVRETYDLGDRLLVAATDRISAYDVVMPDPIPDKGKILTAMSIFWLAKLKVATPHHFLTDYIPDSVGICEGFVGWQDWMHGRTMLVRKAKVIPIECIARGYLAGSGWKEYQRSQTVCGIRLPAGLRQCDKLPEPIFTPSTKEESGHDVNISFEEMMARIGEETAKELRARTLATYSEAAEYAAKRGIIIADTKFEFGRLPNGSIILIDEVLTPDSSRFWPVDKYQPGHDQPSFDKQFLRNYLEGEVKDGRWNKEAPAPRLPDHVIQGTRQRYVEAYERLTGKPWA